ncbi:MAG TPA: hypothetical protein VFH48_03740 [Chloroflexota bacterium]|nr:hypothetical protein [Chloroflexota bacterium]
MRLHRRIGRLERARRDRVSGPCRWHGPLVIYPVTLPLGADGRVILPPCEAPATCPGMAVGQVFLPERRTA